MVIRLGNLYFKSRPFDALNHDDIDNRNKILVFEKK